MSKSKAVLLSMLAVVIAAAIAVGVVGCASKSQPAGSSPSVTTGNGQAGGQPPGLSSQPNGSRRNFNPQQMLDNVKQALAGLVSSGKITQDQSDKVLQAYTQAFANRPQVSGKQGSSQHAGQQGSGHQYSGPVLAQLVSNGTITQDQATAVNQAIGQLKPHHGSRPGVSNSGQTTTQ